MFWDNISNQMGRFYNMKLHKIQIVYQKYDFTLHNSKVQMKVHFVQTISADMSKHDHCANNSVKD